MHRMASVLSAAALLAAGPGLLAQHASGANRPAVLATSKASGPMFPAPGSLRTLADLSNYVADYDLAGTMTFVFRVHAPTNYLVMMGKVQELHLGDTVYTKLGPDWYATAQKPTNELYGVSEQLEGLLKVRGEIIRRAGVCRDAGQAGLLYHLGFKGAGLTEQWSACIDAAHGWLLSDWFGVSYATMHDHARWTITQIGGVPPFKVPSPLAKS